MLELMRELPIFGGLADDALARLAGQMHQQARATGEPLFQQGEVGPVARRLQRRITESMNAAQPATR